MPGQTAAGAALRFRPAALVPDGFHSGPDLLPPGGMRAGCAARRRLPDLPALEARAGEAEAGTAAGSREAAGRQPTERPRERHSWQAVLTSVAKLVLTWVLFAFALWLLRRSLAGTQRFIRRWFEGLARRKGARGLVLLMFERLALMALAVAKLGAGVLVIIWLSILLTYSFSLFPATEGISVSLAAAAWEAVLQAASAAAGYIPRGLFVVVVCVMAYYVLQIARLFFRAIERGDLAIGGLHPETAGISYQLVRLAVVILVLIIVFPYLPGSHTEAFRGVSIFLGVVISLGSGSAVSNMMAGVVLAYMRPFRAGDRVRIADTLGDIVSRGLLVTRLRTIKNVEVTIPNSAILGAQILNYSSLGQQGKLLLHTSVTIGYGVPWRKVHDLLVQAALQTPGVLREPPPFVLQTSLNDFHVTYEINVYTDQPAEMISIHSALHANIQDQFSAAGVEILSPSYYALRDGNDPALPPAEPAPRSFRVSRPE